MRKTQAPPPPHAPEVAPKHEEAPPAEEHHSEEDHSGEDHEGESESESEGEGEDSEDEGEGEDHHHHPEEWLLPLEILELINNLPEFENLAIDIRNFLLGFKDDNKELDRLVENGLVLIK